MEAPEKAKSGLHLNQRRYGTKKPADIISNPKESNLPLLEDRSNVSDSYRHNNAAMNRVSIQKQIGAQKYGSHQKSRVDEGKENSDNSTNKEQLDLNTDAGHDAISKKAGTGNKKYYMDIDSLRQEHADAIKMLEELDKCEVNRRRSLDSDNSADSSYASVEDTRFVGGIQRNQLAYRENNTLDDEFVGSKMSSIPAKQEDPTLTDSFLNMTHLSISLQDDFDGYEAPGYNDDGDDDDGGRDTRILTPKKNRSFADDGNNDAEDDRTLTPLKNRSFTSSCASIEDESDFFGDADVDSYSSSEDGYSSGTF